MFGPLVGIAKYELKMRLRSRGFLVCVLCINAIALIIISPANVPIPIRSAWNAAGQAFLMATAFMSLAAGFFAADRIQRDESLGVRDFIYIAPIGSLDYVMGKYASVIASLALAMLPLVVLAPIVQSIMIGKITAPLPFIIAFFAMYLPSVIFVGSFSLAVATIIRNVKGFYILFVAFWIIGGEFLVLHRKDSIMHLLAFGGRTQFSLFERIAYVEMGLSKELLNQMPPYSALLRDAGMNIAVLLSMSLVVLLLLFFVQKRRLG